MPDKPFAQWLFDSLLEQGIIKDYDKKLPSKGPLPNGSLGINVTRATELRRSNDCQLKVWGLLTQPLIAKELTKKTKNEYNTFCKGFIGGDDLYKAMLQAADALLIEFNKRYQPRQYVREKAQPKPSFDD